MITNDATVAPVPSNTSQGMSWKRPLGFITVFVLLTCGYISSTLAPVHLIVIAFIVLPLFTLGTFPNPYSRIKTISIAIGVSVLQIIVIVMGEIMILGSAGATHQDLFPIPPSFILGVGLFLPLLIWIFYYLFKKKNIVALIISTDIAVVIAILFFSVGLLG